MTLHTGTAGARQQDEQKDDTSHDTEHRLFNARTGDGWVETGQPCAVESGPPTTAPPGMECMRLARPRSEWAAATRAACLALARPREPHETPACSLPSREACLHSSGPLLLYNLDRLALDSLPDCAERPPTSHPADRPSDRCLIAPRARHLSDKCPTVR